MSFPSCLPCSAVRVIAPVLALHPLPPSLARWPRSRPALCAFPCTSMVCALVLVLLLLGAGSAQASIDPGSLASQPLVTTTSTPTYTPTPPPACGLDWRIVPSPNVDQYTNGLNAVAVETTDDIWAVGSRRDASHWWLPMALHWDGTQWAVVPLPPTPIEDAGLGAIEAISSNDVWAVGAQGTSAQTLVMHWNGVQWSIVPSPNIGPHNNLLGVRAAAPDDIWAVGIWCNTHPCQGYNHTLVEHWDGVQWSIVPSPNTGLETTLQDLAVVADNDIWAVGEYLTVSATHTFTVHWDGQQWSIVPSPDAGNQNNMFRRVSATSASDVWAVGYYNSTGSGTRWTRTLIEHWDGQQWSIVPSPNVDDTTHHYLYGVAAVAPNDVWAVGDHNNWGIDFGETLAEHWDGQHWSIVPSPNLGALSRYLGLAAVGVNDYWAVGQYANAAGYGQTQMQHYSDPCITPTPSTPTPTATPATSPTPTCDITFSDVNPSDYFYEAVRYLYCAGVITGYGDNTFRPYNNTTRGQLTKIIVLAEGWPIDTTGGPHFSDVTTSYVFYDYIETAFNRSIISGYGDGTFRPDNNVTRAQLSKIVVLAQDWPIDTTGGPHFTDVPQSHPFYNYIETAYNHTIISGYGDGTFRPDNSATRGQISKIVYQAITNP